MTKLNHDVLKRTTGLLSEIDTVLATPAIAERVERVLSSAVAYGSRLSDTIMEHFDEVFDAWSWGTQTLFNAAGQVAYDHGLSDRVVDRRRLCGCASIAVIHTLPTDPYDGEMHGPYFMEDSMTECEFYGAVNKDYPIGGGIFTNTAAPMGCGVDGCECEALFDTPTYDSLLTKLNAAAAAHFARIDNPERNT